MENSIYRGYIMKKAMIENGIKEDIYKEGWKPSRFVKWCLSNEEQKEWEEWLRIGHMSNSSFTNDDDIKEIQDFLRELDGIS